MIDFMTHMRILAQAAQNAQRMTAPLREFCNQLQHCSEQMAKIAKTKKPLDLKLKEVQSLHESGSLTEEEYKRARMLLVEAYAKEKA